jgi:hypothetical protein
MKTQSVMRTRFAAVLAAFLLAALTACSEFFEPQPYPKAHAEGEAFPLAILLGDGAENTAGTDYDQAYGLAAGMRNYIELIVLDDQGRLAGWSEHRDAGGGRGSLSVPELDSGREYTFLALMGHWQRDYARGTPENYAYIENEPPTLLAAGYTQGKPQDAEAGDIVVTMHPLTITTSFTAPGADPVTAGRGKPVEASLPAGDWTAHWDIAQTGLCQLLYAQGLSKDSADVDKIFPPAGRKGLLRPGRDSAQVLVFSGVEVSGIMRVSANIREHTQTLTPTEKPRYVNFNLTYKPLAKGEVSGAPGPAAPLRAALGPWIIRNGINDLPQDENTDFSAGADWRTGARNGNGAAAFTVAHPHEPLPPLEPLSLKAARVYDDASGDYIEVTWEVDPADPAQDYKVYLSTDAVEPEQPVQTVHKGGAGHGTYTAHIAGHDPAQDYNVWVNVITESDTLVSGPYASPSVMVHPVNSRSGIEEALNGAVKKSRVKKHILRLTADTTISGGLAIDLGDTAKTLWIQGPEPVVMRNAGSGPLLTIAGGSVTAGANVTLDGAGGDVVRVSGGAFTIKGAVITGGGSGVVVSGGAAEMSGGRIWGNGSNGVEMTGGACNMTGGEIGANGANGVSTSGSGVFTKRGGGTVYGKHETAEQKNSLGSINGKANTYGPNDDF